MAVERNLIFLYPLAPVINELKKQLEEDATYTVYEMDSIEESLKKFKQSTSESFSDSNQQVLDLSNTISDQMAELNTSLINRLESNSNQLQTSKVDRSSLAMMLTDLAYNIAGENESADTEQA